MDLLAKLKLGRDALGNVTVNNVKIGLRVLTDQDYQIAHMAADKMLADHDTEFSLSTAEAFEVEKSVQLIFLAAVDLETRKPVFASVDECRATLMREDREIISEEYLKHEQSFSPSERNLTDAQFAALLQDVKKNPASPRLSALSGATLIRLITTLASQLLTLQKDNGSSS